MDDPMELDAIPVGPKPIRKLDQDVVNQIAASEVSFPQQFSPSNHLIRSL
jgi:hypothetical protein